MVFGIWLPERYDGRGRCGFYFFGNSPSMTRAMRSAMSDISGCPSQRARAVMPRWSAKKSSSIRGSSPHPKDSSRSSSPAARTAARPVPVRRSACRGPPAPCVPRRRTAGRRRLRGGFPPGRSARRHRLPPLRHTAGQLRRRFAGRGRGLGERQVVAERHGLGLEAPESVAVVERHSRGGETLLAVGPQFDAHESRHPRRIAFCGGEGLDAGREACGCISPAEQLARCGVEPCGVRLRIAGAPRARWTV